MATFGIPIEAQYYRLIMKTSKQLEFKYVIKTKGGIIIKRNPITIHGDCVECESVDEIAKDPKLIS